jgi:hypothetical protein
MNMINRITTLVLITVFLITAIRTLPADSALANPYHHEWDFTKVAPLTLIVCAVLLVYFGKRNSKPKIKNSAATCEKAHRSLNLGKNISL